MRRAVSLPIAAPLLVVLTSCGLYEQAEMKHRVEGRVTTVLEGSRSSGGTATIGQQTAVCQWHAGKNILMDPAELDRAVDAFDRWRQEAGIYNNLTSFNIESVEIVEESVPETAIVSGTINGEQFKMKVPDRQRISWLKKPR